LLKWIQHLVKTLLGRDASTDPTFVVSEPEPATSRECGGRWRSSGLRSRPYRVILDQE